MAVVAAALLLLVGCDDEPTSAEQSPVETSGAIGPDELGWYLSRGAAPFGPKSKLVSASVRLGCVPGFERTPEKYRVDGYSVQYAEGRVIVSFTGRRSRSNLLCLTTDQQEIELREELGDRDLFDGSFQPPRKVKVGP